MTAVTGMVGFPLTPLSNDAIDERGCVGIIERLGAAGVDGIAVLGSTGSYAYLNRAERRRVAQLALRHAGETPVIVGVGALRTSDVLAGVRDAEEAGAAGVLLAPMTYQPLTDDDVFELFSTVAERTALPIIAYDNPVTTHFTFTPELTARIAELPGVASLKVPGATYQHADPAIAAERVAELRRALPAGVTIGASGDAFAAAALNAGCDAWYSVIGGLLPDLALSLTRAAQAGNASAALEISERAAPLWRLFAEFGSIRVVAALAEHLGLCGAGSLPLPIRGLTAPQRGRVAAAAAELRELALLS